jgi:hypothetical protein
LTPEEIEDLLTNPDPQTPSHHQVDLRIIKAYLMGESIPTYHPGYWLSHYFGILPALSPGLSYMETKIGRKYRGHSLFS